MMEVLLSLGVLGQELLNFHYRRGAILSQKLLNRELLNIRYLLYTGTLQDRTLAVGVWYEGQDRLGM